jgi:hypothetical protein
MLVRVWRLAHLESSTFRTQARPHSQTNRDNAEALFGCSVGCAQQAECSLRASALRLRAHKEVSEVEQATGSATLARRTPVRRRALSAAAQLGVGYVPARPRPRSSPRRRLRAPPDTSRMHALDAYDPKAVGGGGGGHACLVKHPKTTMETQCGTRRSTERVAGDKRTRPALPRPRQALLLGPQPLYGW